VAVPGDSWLFMARTSDSSLRQMYSRERFPIAESKAASISLTSLAIRSSSSLVFTITLRVVSLSLAAFSTAPAGLSVALSSRMNRSGSRISRPE